jgi:putative endonuclease
VSGATIYILRCSDGSYYTGITRRPVEERVSEHALGLHDGYTFTRRPVTLVHAESYERIDEAIAAERRIKGWSRAKKEAYIRGDFAALTALSLRRSGAAGASFETRCFASLLRMRPVDLKAGLGVALLRNRPDGFEPKTSS